MKIKYLLPLLSLGFLFSRKPFPETIFKLDNLEIFYLNERRSLYPNQTIARFFDNKATRIFYRFKRNFFDGLDPNLYFFASHPRERPRTVEKERFNWLLLPLFLFGVYCQVKKRTYWTMTYFIFTLFFISMFLQMDNYLFLLFPFFFFSILLGGYRIFKKSVELL